MLFAIIGSAKRDDIITIHTSMGDMIVLLYNSTPKHKSNFVKLCSEGFYNGTTFHRIITDFMIQGGDPNSKDTIAENDGLGGPAYTIPNEINPQLKHRFGALASARMGDAVNPNKESNGSQFYIVQNHNGTPHLDGGYTVFGQVVFGMEIIDKIASVPKDYRDRPLQNIAMNVDIQSMKKKKIIKKYSCEGFYNQEALNKK